MVTKNKEVLCIFQHNQTQKSLLRCPLSDILNAWKVWNWERELKILWWCFVVFVITVKVMIKKSICKFFAVFLGAVWWWLYIQNPVNTNKCLEKKRHTFWNSLLQDTSYIKLNMSNLGNHWTEPEHKKYSVRCQAHIIFMRLKCKSLSPLFLP